MKIRLEIIDDEGKESTSIEFAGVNVKERVIKFIDTLEEVQPRSIGSSSSALRSEHNVQQHFSQQTSATTTEGFVSQPQSVVSPQYPQQYCSVPVMPFQQQAQPIYQTVQVPVQQVQQYPQYYVPVNQQTVSPTVNPVVNQPAVYQQPAQPQQSAVSSGTFSPSGPSPAAMTQQQVPQFNNNSNNKNNTVPSVSLHDRVNDSKLTISERLELFLKYEHPREWSTSQQIQENYERVYGEIKLSTVSTYLSRMYRKNLLERRGNRTQREYLYIADVDEAGQAAPQGIATVWQIQRV